MLPSCERYVSTKIPHAQNPSLSPSLKLSLLSPTPLVVIKTMNICGQVATQQLTCCLRLPGLCDLSSNSPTGNICSSTVSCGNVHPSGCTDNSFNKVLKQDLLVSPDHTARQQNVSVLTYSVMRDKTVFCWYAVPWAIAEAGGLNQHHEPFFRVRINMKD